MNVNESLFEFNELFFSRTDSRGFILSGNSVFQRVSEYGWEELLQHPHNVIRHPDMPKGVFHLFWKRLREKKSIGAFVKNRSKSGKYYWVFALAVPHRDGFLSIRMKPSGKFYTLIQDEYAFLLEKEKVTALSPEASEELLLSRLRDLGFRNYESFMIEAFMECIQQRESELGRPLISVLQDLHKLQEKAVSIEDLASSTLRAFKDTEYVPINLEIQTNQLGDLAAPLAVVASKYNQVANEIREKIHGFKASSLLVYEKVIATKLLICSAVLQDEMYRLFQTEAGEETVDLQSEMDTLKSLRDSSILSSKRSLKEISEELTRFQQSSDDLRAQAMGLEIIRLMGKIEVERIGQPSGELHVMISLLDKFKKQLADELQSIRLFGQQIELLTRSMMGDKFFQH